MLAVTFALGLLTTPLAPHVPAVVAQSSAVPVRLGWLSYISQPDPALAILREGLRDLGYVVLTLNMRAAKTLGLTVPPAILARADRVIE